MKELKSIHCILKNKLIAFYKKRFLLMLISGIVLSLMIVKFIWVTCACWSNGSFDRERDNLLERRKYLVDRIITSPRQLLREMPGGMDFQFVGEWALYSCSMLSQALVNMAYLYPETREESVVRIDDLIKIVMSEDLRLYDKFRWGEDPLETLAGNHSHISYLSHLAWMIGNYKEIGGSSKYDDIYGELCETMNRRIKESGIMNLPTYPEENIYTPDMLVAIVALSRYSVNSNDYLYSSTVTEWIDKAKKDWLDNDTGLLVSFLSNITGQKIDSPVKGSYSALSCYYLSLIDGAFAYEQYGKLKKFFMQDGWLCGVKEYWNESCIFGFDIDAGPVLFNLSPSGTAFAVGSATYFEDSEFRQQLLSTAEIAGSTISAGGKSHYLLAEVALVGEAIMLAMRTNINAKQSIDTRSHDIALNS